MLTFEISSQGNVDILGATLTIGADYSAPSASALIHYIAPKDESLLNSKSFFIEEIYTNWKRNGNNFWRSNEWVESATKTGKNCSTCPNDYHELIGYKMRDGTIYSTGVANDILETNLNLTQTDIDQGLYGRKIFKAYSTNGVKGLTNSGNYIVTGDLIDKVHSPNESDTNSDLSSLVNINNLTIFDVIIDGKNGLELGTGITNFNTSTDVQFFSGNGKPGAVNDGGAPDLLITQIAQAGGTDVYYYSDEIGNVVGRPLKLEIPNNNSTVLANWRLDLFSFPSNQPFTTATPNRRGFTSNQDEYRPIRMAAFKLEDFEISTPAQVDIINKINMNAGGTADIAFMAYNQDSFDIKGPVAKNVLSQFVCDIHNNSSVTFRLDDGVNGNVGIDDDAGGIRIPQQGTTEELSYQLLRFNLPITPVMTTPSLTVTEIDLSKLGVYKIKISNGQGTSFALVNLSEGGTPYTWESGSWTSPYGAVNPEERSLVFASSYSGNVDLEDCDCFVSAGVNVTIPSNIKMKLYGSITVASKVDEVKDGDGNVIVTELSAGTFTLENNASLLQTKLVTENENNGNIRVKREASNLHTNDYVYWSSPVFGNKVANIPGSSRFEWDVNKVNTNTSTIGNWIAPTSEFMVNGKGYIVRVPSAINFTSTFTGVPNNGPIEIKVFKTGSGVTSGMTDGDLHWNLIGNPYPSAINVDDFLEVNAASIHDEEAIYGGVYLWQHKTIISKTDSPFYEVFGLNYSADDYLAYNLTAPIDPSFLGNIASGQGFFVRAKSDNIDVKFTNAMRIDTNKTAYDNSQFYRSSGEIRSSNESEEKQLIWLALSNESKYATVAVVGYVKGASYGEDNLYDTTTMGDGDFSLYYNVANKRMAIQGRPLPFDNEDKVTLGVAVPKNGIYNIGIDHLKGSHMLSEDQGIYLEDTYNNVIHDLKNAPYGFTAIAGDVKDRFVLRYTNKTLSVDDKQVSETFVYVKYGQLYVKAANNIESVVVYDLTGKKLMDYKLDGYSDTFNTQFQFSRGAYLTVIKLENSGTITKKVMN